MFSMPLVTISRTTPWELGHYMGLNRKLILLGLLYFCCLPWWCSGKSLLPVIATKQDIENLRYISLDGKYTYFQRKSGEFILSSSYDTFELIKEKSGTQFLVTSSAAHRRILISAVPHWHNQINSRLMGKIFVAALGEKKAREIARGHSPKLHLQDSWASFYDPSTQEINFLNLDNLITNFKIKLKNTINPYFIPEVVMLNENTVLYSDINLQGVQGIIQLSRRENKTQVMFKSPSEKERLELCLNDTYLYIGQWGNDKTLPGSALFQFERKNLSFQKNNSIYESSLNDLGSLICELVTQQVVFIKNTTVLNGKESFEVAVLKLKGVTTEEAVTWNIHNVPDAPSLPGGTLALISDVGQAGQIINMDGRILLPFQGQYYLLNGKNDQDKDILMPLKNIGDK
jgi:hypothetical protein